MRSQVSAKGSTPSLIDIWDNAQPFEDGVFRLKGADPNKTYQVFFLQFRRLPGRRCRTEI